MEQTKKYNNVSLLRIFAILMIFIFHFAQPLSETHGRQFFPLYFGVQIFLFISGFLYSFKNIASYKYFFKRNITKIVYPTILFILLCLISGGMFALLTNTRFLDFFKFESPYEEILYNYGHLWYIPAIVFCYLSLPVLKKLKNKKLSYLLLSLFFIADVALMMLFDIQIIFAPFFAGFMFFKLTQSKSYENLKKWILILSGFVIVGASVAYFFVFNSTFLAEKVAWLRYFLKESLTGLIAISFSILFFEAFNFTNKFIKLSSLLGYTDKYIFSFYFMHSFVILSGAGFMLTISQYIAINVILILNISIISCVIFQKIIDLTINKLPWMK